MAFFEPTTLVRFDEPRAVYVGIRPIVFNCKDGSVLIEVPAGEFEMGDGKDNDCPKHRVWLDSYYIGIFCVTNRQYTKFVRETSHRLPDKADYGDPVWKSGRCPEDKLDHPVVCVGWDDAVAYAKWAGSVLPTEAQWEKAARGPKGLIYPWGNEWEEARCRNSKNRGNEQTAKVWAYGQGSSGSGTVQQSGNVWEWCSDWYDSNGYRSSGVVRNPSGPPTGSYRVRRGGSWWASIRRSSGARTAAGLPSYRDGYLGFRLARAVS